MQPTAPIPSPPASVAHAPAQAKDPKPGERLSLIHI